MYALVHCLKTRTVRKRPSISRSIYLRTLGEEAKGALALREFEK